MFIVANRVRKPISRLDDFNAAVAAGDEDALEIQQLVTDAGLRVARQVSQTGWEPGEVAFTSSIASAIRKFGAKNTATGLKHLSAVFSDKKLIHGGPILAALAMFLSKVGVDVDSDLLNRALRSKKLEEWGLATAGMKCGGVAASPPFTRPLRKPMTSHATHRTIPGNLCSEALFLPLSIGTDRFHDLSVPDL